MAAVTYVSKILLSYPIKDTALNSGINTSLRSADKTVVIEYRKLLLINAPLDLVLKWGDSTLLFLIDDGSYYSNSNWWFRNLYLSLFNGGSLISGRNYLTGNTFTGISFRNLFYC